MFQIDLEPIMRDLPIFVFLIAAGFILGYLFNRLTWRAEDQRFFIDVPEALHQRMQAPQDEANADPQEPAPHAVNRPQELAPDAENLQNRPLRGYDEALFDAIEEYQSTSEASSQSEDYSTAWAHNAIQTDPLSQSDQQPAGQLIVEVEVHAAPAPPAPAAQLPEDVRSSTAPASEGAVNAPTRQRRKKTATAASVERRQSARLLAKKNKKIE